jgi:hypothetical protein
VATLSNGVGGGLALARYNTTTSDLEVTETWATNRFDYINPADWLNGWTLSANLTIKDDTNRKNYWIFLHAFAVYSNGTHAGGGRGVALNLTIGPIGTAPTDIRRQSGYFCPSPLAISSPSRSCTTARDF